MTTAPEYTLVDTPDALSAALAALQASPVLALDFEMENHCHHYGLHLALIQFATQDSRIFVIDPLAKIELHPVGHLLLNPQHQLIIHDAEFDKRACHQILGWRLTNLFDTKLAAQLCGIRQFGLASLLSELMGLTLDKKFQRCDWLKRPLIPAALSYAALDVASLHTLRDILTERLTQLGRLEWAREEFLRSETSVPADAEPPSCFNIKGSAALTPRQLTVLDALFRFRDPLARTLNRPVHYVIRNETLLQLAVTPPSDERTVRAINGLHPLLYREEQGRRFLAAIQEGLTAPELQHPAWDRTSTRVIGAEQRLKAMQEWRKTQAAPLDLEPYLLLPNDILKWCARHADTALPPDVASNLRRWQTELVWDAFRRQFSIPDA